MIIIARASNQLLVAVIVSIVIVAFAIFLVVSAFTGRRRKADVPPALRPGPSDEELESKFLPKVLAAGTVSVLFMALYLPGLWLREPTRIKLKEKQFAAESIHRGEILWRDPNFSEHFPGAPFFAANCQRCHGTDGEGTVQVFKEKYTYAEPPLKYIVARYKKAGKNDDDIRQLIRDAIERGRPGTLMPTWGLSFNGPLNSQQVDDLINFIYSIQAVPDGLGDVPVTAAEGAKIFDNNCMVCHTRPDAKNPLVRYWGGVGPDLRLALNRVALTDIYTTIFEGRVNYFRPSMPAWAYLGKSAVNALTEFIKSIQLTTVGPQSPYAAPAGAAK